METQGSRLKKIRKELKLSQEEFGKQIGLTRAAIAAVEADNNKFSNDVLCKLILTFDVNVNYYHQLVKYILAGEQGCREIETYIAQRQADMEASGDNSIQFEIQSLNQALMMLEQRTQDLDAREKSLLARELKATAIEELAREQLPAALADCFNYESEEAFKLSKEKVVKAFQESIKEAVNARLRGKKPPKTSGEGAKSGNVRKNTFSEVINSQRSRR